jgi:hypothetical protein
MAGDGEGARLWQEDCDMCSGRAGPLMAMWPNHGL